MIGSTVRMQEDLYITGSANFLNSPCPCLSVGNAVAAIKMKGCLLGF